MKILQISNYYYPHIGGIEQVANDCAKALSGYDQKVFCFNHEKGDKTEIIDGVGIVRAGCFAKVASQSLSFSYYKNLKKVFKGFNPDVVIFHYPNPFAAHYLLKLLKKYRNCRLVVYWHLDIVKQKILGKLFNGQTKRLLKRAEKIVATSPDYIAGSKFLSANKEKCTVIPCCVNTERMAYSEADMQAAKLIKEKNAGKTVLFAVGRHVPYKGIGYLVEASKYLSGDYVVYIGGEGPLTEELKKNAADDEKVIFLGKITDGELKAYLKACDIFCFPSITKNEAFGIALAEALWYGKPAVTFKVEGSGINYVSLNGETGIEVENGNAEKFAEAIKTLAGNKELREKYGEAARERVERLFTYERFAESVQNLISSLAEEDRQ